jgi:hypothetical protein
MVALISHFLRFWLQFTRKNCHWFKPMVLKKKPSGLRHGLSQRGLNQTALGIIEYNTACSFLCLLKLIGTFIIFLIILYLVLAYLIHRIYLHLHHFQTNQQPNITLLKFKQT